MGPRDYASDASPPGEDAFAQMLIDGIRRAGETGAIHFDPEQFALTNARQATLNLANAYREYCSAPPDIRQEVFQKWVRAWFLPEKPTPEEYEDIRPDLLPVVRRRGYYELQ